MAMYALLASSSFDNGRDQDGPLVVDEEEELTVRLLKRTVGVPSAITWKLGPTHYLTGTRDQDALEPV